MDYDGWHRRIDPCATPLDRQPLLATEDTEITEVSASTLYHGLKKVFSVSSVGSVAYLLTRVA